MMRELIQCLLLQPELARDITLPPGGVATAEAAALHALIDYCHDCGHPLTTPAVMQAFSATDHERIFAEALATATDHALPQEQAQMALADGVARLWPHAARSGHADSPERGVPAWSAEETERLRQLAIVRQAAAQRPDRSEPGDE
jgi:hypothetical protein